MHGNHLVPKSVRGVQEVACFGEQDEVLNRLARTDRPIGFHHVPEGLHPCAGKNRRGCVDSMRAPLEVGPIHDQILTYPPGNRRQSGDVGFRGRGYRYKSAQDWNTKARGQQDQETNLMSSRNTSFLLRRNTSHGIIGYKCENLKQPWRASENKANASRKGSRQRAFVLKVESDCSGNGSRRNVVRSAKR